MTTVMMQNLFRRSCVACCCVASAAFLPRAVAAQPAPSTAPVRAATAAAAPAAGPITVGILDFQSNAPGGPELGQQIADTLVATLSGRPGFTLVDRSALQRTLQEQELNLSGVVSAAQATKVGKVVGARLLVTGKAFAIDKQVMITAKVIGTETSLVDGVIVKGAKDADLAELVLQLADKLAARLVEAGPRLVAAPEATTDPLPDLKRRLAGLKLPKVAIGVAERHVAQPGGRAAGIDSAVETELKQLLTQCGFTVIDGDAKDVAREGVEVVISGEAFSEFAARIGNLVSCMDRVEIKVTRARDGKVLLADKDDSRAVDLAENLAAKHALQKSGRVLGLRILEHFANELPKEQPASTKAP